MGVMQRLRQLALTSDDPRDVRRVKLRARSWGLLNLGVVALPAAFRGLGLVFAGNEFWPLLHLEEVFFFSLFVCASALIHLIEFTQDPRIQVDEALYWHTWAIRIAALLLAFIYGVAFSGEAGFSTPQILVLIGFMILGVGLAFNGQLLMVDYALARAYEREA